MAAGQRTAHAVAHQGRQEVGQAPPQAEPAGQPHGRQADHHEDHEREAVSAAATIRHAAGGAGGARAVALGLTLTAALSLGHGAPAQGGIVFERRPPRRTGPRRRLLARAARVPRLRARLTAAEERAGSARARPLRGRSVLPGRRRRGRGRLLADGRDSRQPVGRPLRPRASRPAPPRAAPGAPVPWNRATVSAACTAPARTPAKSSPARRR